MRLLLARWRWTLREWFAPPLVLSEQWRLERLRNRRADGGSWE
jgi:hypothetical protein